MILCSLKGELRVFVQELFRFVFVQLTGLFFTLWFWRSPRRTLPAPLDPLLLEPATALAAKVRSGKLKSADIVRAYVKRIKEVNPILNAVVDDRFEDAVAEAEDVDRRIAQGTNPVGEQPFLGVPFTVKNSIGVQGCAQDVGAFKWKGRKADEDAEMVSLMRKAGGIPVAITNVPELCLSIDCRNMVYGDTCNPYDTNRTSSGSSGGEASLLGAAASVIGLGTDLAGSIRTPASSCGVFGHKPTNGVLSRIGVFPDRGEAVSKFSVVGPMCRYAQDLMPMLRIMAGKNAPKLNLDAPVDLKKIKLYYVSDDGTKYLSCMLQAQTEAVLKVMDHLEVCCGSKAKRLTLPEIPKAYSMWIASIKVGNPPPFSDLIKSTPGALSTFSELFLKMIGRSNHTMIALLLCLRDLVQKYFPNAQMHADLAKQGQDLTKKLEDLLGDDAVLIFPSSAFEVPYHGQWLCNVGSMNHTCLFNTTMMPATACPIYLNARSGMPVGIQVVAGRYQDRLCLAVARELEAHFGGWKCPGA